MVAKQSNGVGQLSEMTSFSSSPVVRLATVSVWLLFVFSITVLASAVWGSPGWSVSGIVAIDGLTVVMWVVITFFSGIIHSYSRRYMAGNEYLNQFYTRIFGFTLVVMILVAADHIALLVAAWLAMGLVMASLIGHVRDWQQAQAAAGLARRYFLASTAFLAAGLAILSSTTGTTAISGIIENVGTVPQWAVFAAVGCLVLAAMIQSALFPFHSWLLSSMTAPTPASALMHAGFVNAGGILLTRFAPVVAEEIVLMSAIVFLGAVSALLGQALLLIQTDIKRKLGSSTLAQMGFMILQCGLGFFSAAIAHLILHGFYKAYLFLSAGATVEQTAPTKTKETGLGVSGLTVSFLTAVGGGLLFTVLTGKGTSLSPNSGMVLTLVVVLTTLTAARDILGRMSLSPAVRLTSMPLVVLVAIGCYAVLFNFISTMLSGVPMTQTPTDLTVVHVVVAALFTGSFVVTELGLHHRSKRLYVALLNRSQPAPKTVLTQKEDYNDT